MTVDYLRPIEPLSAKLLAKEPDFIANLPPEQKRGARADGLRYESFVQSYMLDFFGDFYLPGPWLSYIIPSGKICYCQPDGILFDFPAGIITIFEIKLAHTDVAYFQLRHCYEPVLRTLFGSYLWQYAVCEVVEWFDSARRYPVSVTLRKAPNQCRPSQFSVHILHRGRGNSFMRENLRSQR